MVRSDEFDQSVALYQAEIGHDNIFMKYESELDSDDICKSIDVILDNVKDAQAWIVSCIKKLEHTGYKLDNHSAVLRQFA